MMNSNCLTQQGEQFARRFNLSDADLSYILDNGYYTRREEHEFVLLRPCDLPLEAHRQDQFARLIGTVLILNAQQQVLKVERTHDHKKFKHPYQRPCRHLARLLENLEGEL